MRHAIRLENSVLEVEPIAEQARSTCSASRLLQRWLQA